MHSKSQKKIVIFPFIQHQPLNWLLFPPKRLCINHEEIELSFEILPRMWYFNRYCCSKLFALQCEVARGLYTLENITATLNGTYLAILSGLKKPPTLPNCFLWLHDETPHVKVIKYSSVYFELCPVQVLITLIPFAFIPNSMPNKYAVIICASALLIARTSQTRNGLNFQATIDYVLSHAHHFIDRFAKMRSQKSMIGHSD